MNDNKINEYLGSSNGRISEDDDVSLEEKPYR